MTDADILGLEAERRAAMLAGDADRLERLFDADAAYYPGAGGRQSTAQTIASIRSGTVRYERIEVAEEEVILFPDSAVVTGLLTMDVVVAGEKIVNRRRFADVWVRRPEGWKLGVYYGTMVESDPDEIRAEIAAGVRRALAARDGSGAAR